MAVEEKELVGMPRCARIAHVSHPTIMLAAARAEFPTERIDGRLFARVADIKAWKRSREAQRRREKIPA